MSEYRKKLIEVALPLTAINDASAEEKAVPRHGHPSTLHLWWARRPLAASRAMIFAQLVDDPSAHPTLFPTEAAQDAERERLFELMTQLVQWDAIRDEDVLSRARHEIAVSLARSAKQSDLTRKVLAAHQDDPVIRQFLREEAPIFHDPFAGGGSIPVEAMRLGLSTVATDLNPVAVLINKAQLEYAKVFAGSPPSGLSRSERSLGGPWSGLRGLAEDVRFYGAQARQQAALSLAPIYKAPPIPGQDHAELGTPIAFLWARTARSPDPAYSKAHTPLVSNLILSERPERAAWIQLVVDKKNGRWHPEVRQGLPPDRAAAASGTKVGRGSFRCVFSGTPIDSAQLRKEGIAGRLGRRLMAVVVEKGGRRYYVAPNKGDEALAESCSPEWIPETELPHEALGFRVQNYGITRHADLFLPRQLTALSTFARAIREAAADAERAFLTANPGRPDDAKGYGDAIAVFLSFALAKMADWSSMYCGFIYGYEKFGHTFGKQTLSMIWDFAELNPLSDAVGNWTNHVSWVADAVEMLPVAGVGQAYPADAAQLAEATDELRGKCFSTDPPYYDNIGYADLSDYFYVWLRHILRERFPDLFRTMLVPKTQELVAAPARFNGDRRKAHKHFEDGLRSAFRVLRAQTDSGICDDPQDLAA